MRKRALPLRGIATRGQGGHLAFALESTNDFVQLFEEYFDIPYPYKKLDLVAVSEFRSGCMENAGAIFCAVNRVLLGSRPSPHRMRRFAWLHAHEIAHGWFGNLVTPAW